MNLRGREWQAVSQSGGYGEAASSHNKTLSMHRWANWIAGFSGEFAHNAIVRFLPGEILRCAQNDRGGGHNYARSRKDDRGGGHNYARSRKDDRGGGHNYARSRKDDRGGGQNYAPGRRVGRQGCVVVDPFAGVGTTLVEAQRLGLDCVGFEINPFAALVCRVKLGAADVCLAELQDAVGGYNGFMAGADGRQPDSLPPAGFRSRIPFFSPAVERKVLFTLDYLDGLAPPVKDVFRVAFASVMVEFSNYSYEPSLGTRPGAGKPLVDDADVGGIVGGKLRDMAADIAELQQERDAADSGPEWRVYERSFFDAESCVDAASVDLVVTSPPYMNNYHYVRNSRPQLFWTGLVESSRELKGLETGNFGKFWQTVRGDGPIPLVPQLPRLAEEIAEIRGVNSDRGVYGGNGWANYVTAYMNDLDRFCELLARILKPGGTAVVVVGNSIVQGREVKVEERLCDIAELRGLSVEGVTRLRERVGSSIVGSGARLSGDGKAGLYDAAVALRRFRAGLFDF